MNKVTKNNIFVGIFFLVLVVLIAHFGLNVFNITNLGSTNIFSENSYSYQYSTGQGIVTTVPYSSTLFDSGNHLINCSGSGRGAYQFITYSSPTNIPFTFRIVDPNAPMKQYVWSGEGKNILTDLSAGNMWTITWSGTAIVKNSSDGKSASGVDLFTDAGSNSATKLGKTLLAVSTGIDSSLSGSTKLIVTPNGVYRDGNKIAALSLSNGIWYLDGVAITQLYVAHFVEENLSRDSSTVFCMPFGEVSSNLSYSISVDNSVPTQPPVTLPSWNFNSWFQGIVDSIINWLSGLFK